LSNFENKTKFLIIVNSNNYHSDLPFMVKEKLASHSLWNHLILSMVFATRFHSIYLWIAVANETPTKIIAITCAITMKEH
jgi:hypothetical protein